MPENRGNVTMDIVRILEVCRDVELYCAEIYSYYAGAYEGKPELAKMWGRTAAEEETHANQFVLAIKLRKQGVISAVNIDQYVAENTLHLVKSIYENVRSSTPSMEDALRSSIKLEEKLAEFHLTYMANFPDENMRKLFTAMMKADNHHLERLKQMHERVIAHQI
jgi:rubrerythrin